MAPAMAGDLGQPAEMAPLATVHPEEVRLEAGRQFARAETHNAVLEALAATQLAEVHYGMAAAELAS